MFDYQMHSRILVWMETAAEELRRSHQRDLKIEEKKNAADLVTEMDKATETFFVQKIREHYPEHQIIGEEGINDAPVTDVSGTVWVIDPIDGTLNFVKQKKNFGIMLAIFEDGLPKAGYIYDVMSHDLYYGIVGVGVFRNHQILEPFKIQTISEALIVGNIGMFATNRGNSLALLTQSLGARAYGAAALEIISVLKGEAAVYYSCGLQPWDFAAGWALCEALGFKATTPDNQTLNLLKRCPVVFGNPLVHAEALQLLKETKEIGEINENS